jgi:HEPN domain-containing protein
MEAERHEWACFAAHQASEKALKALNLALDQQAWGHTLGLPQWNPKLADSLEQDLR